MLPFGSEGSAFGSDRPRLQFGGHLSALIGGESCRRRVEKPIDELIAERNRIDQLVANRIEAEKKAIAAKLALIERFETGARQKVSQPHRSSATHRSRAAPKYQNPSTGETWAGRGKQPRWMRKAIEAGHKQEDFRIPE